MRSWRGRRREAKPFTAILNPDAFLEPGDMPRRIAEYCQATGQRAPSGPADVSRRFWRAWPCGIAKCWK